MKAVFGHGLGAISVLVRGVAGLPTREGDGELPERAGFNLGRVQADCGADSVEAVEVETVVAAVIVVSVGFSAAWVFGKPSPVSGPLSAAPITLAASRA